MEVPPAPVECCNICKYLLGMKERVRFKYELLILSQPLASGNATKLLRLPEDVKSVGQLSNFQ